jgi:hypothetical protein
MKHQPDLSVPGVPYDHKKKITCPHCLDLIWQERAKLCKKYEWDKWPSDLKGAVD